MLKAAHLPLPEVCRLAHGAHRSLRPPVGGGRAESLSTDSFIPVTTSLCPSARHTASQGRHRPQERRSLQSLGGISRSRQVLGSGASETAASITHVHACPCEHVCSAHVCVRVRLHVGQLYPRKLSPLFWDSVGPSRAPEGLPFQSQHGLPPASCSQGACGLWSCLDSLTP